MKILNYIAAVALSLAVTIPAYAQKGHGGRGNASGQQGQRTPAPGFNTQRPDQSHGVGATPLHGPGPHAGDWLRRYMQLPASEQEKKLEQDQQFKQLPPDRQQRLKDRLMKFNSMSPDQKQRVLNRMEVIEHLRPDQQQRAHDLFRQFHSLDENRRKAVVQQLRVMRDMSPDDRQKTLDSDQVKSGFSDQERELLKGLNELGLNGRPQ